MQRRSFLRGAVAGSAGIAFAPAARAQAGTAPRTRSEWLSLMDRVARPVLQAASEGRLQERMPVEAAAGLQEDRRKVTHLEAVARTLSGLAPWLEHGPADGAEGSLRRQYVSWAQGAIASGVDKRSPGYLRFGEERQTVVDAGFLALAIARAPRTLREALAPAVRAQFAEALRATRHQIPPFNNWLLFAAMVEAALLQLGEDWDRMRVDYALREHAAWYLGDGVYGDGPHFHADYYNSFVIHPFLLALLDVVGGEDPAWKAMVEPVHVRATRYAALQERMIAPDGTFPAIGRSLAYRCGAFHLLADAAQRNMLPEAIKPEQVRCALGAVLERTLLAPNAFDERGWLQIGLAGHQPSISETYISTGSLYLCTEVFLPLGLSATHAFWSGPETPWTGKRAWSGENLSVDHAIGE